MPMTPRRSICLLVVLSNPYAECGSRPPCQRAVRLRAPRSAGPYAGHLDQRRRQCAARTLPARLFPVSVQHRYRIWALYPHKPIILQDALRTRSCVALVRSVHLERAFAPRHEESRQPMRGGGPGCSLCWCFQGLPHARSLPCALTTGNRGLLRATYETAMDLGRHNFGTICWQGLLAIRDLLREREVT
ncbi:hypothetical protein FA95DRAFT_225325 [Auriscalpium vulgare]|uniref:Uncharacterized protein n=1 Tax=Auriscalpium vulgare TaxID=40419 RepID=A0ACB8RKP1_9AGAM|nr:hypothetical protein FA95DRAFT_225325 [Auriscalpium vulgare]